MSDEKFMRENNLIVHAEPQQPGEPIPQQPADADNSESRCEVLKADRAKLISAVESCKRWFEMWSPTAPLISGEEAKHPMLEMLENTLKDVKS